MVLRAASEAGGRGSLASAYDAKADSYFAGARADFVSELPADASLRVLEIGCGSGATGALALRLARCGSWTGIDICERAAARARHVLCEVLVGDIEHLELPWREASFDALVMSEVLEHLIDPWRTLARLSRLLEPGALVLASSPNVAHYQVVLALLRGRFDLADQGTFDRTHMRWFTPRSYAALFEGAGFEVEAIKPVVPFAARTRAISRATGGRLDHLFMRQIWLKARKRRA